MKKFLFILIIIPLLFSCSKKWKGCTDSIATNFREKAGKDDGSCVYTTLTFYADSTQYPGSMVDHIKITVDGTSPGSLTSVFSIGSVLDCNEAGTVSFSFEDAGKVSWSSEVFLIDGSSTLRSGTALPDPLETCVLINAL